MLSCMQWITCIDYDLDEMIKITASCHHTICTLKDMDSSLPKALGADSSMQADDFRFYKSKDSVY